MADEVDEGADEGTEIEASGVSDQASADLERLVADKMESIHANADKDQADESEQIGNETPENPDGNAADEVIAEQEVGGQDEGLTTEDPSLAELEVAKVQAVADGDYERAIELRDQIKEAEANAALQEAPKEKAGKGKDGVLSADQREILKAIEGWTDEDLKILEMQPAFAKMTYRRAQEKFNAKSLEYAQKAVRSGAEASAQPGASPAANAQTATLDSLYKNLDKFAEVAGSEMVENFIKPLKAEVLDPVRDVIAFVQEARARAIADEGHAAMRTIATGDFEGTYGDNPEKLNDVQKNNRSMLFDAADRIVAGAASQGIKIPVKEALNRAHLMLTANIQIANSRATARKELVRQAKTRANQITSRPSKRVARLTPQSTQAAEANVEKFWDKQGEA